LALLNSCSRHPEFTLNTGIQRELFSFSLNSSMGEDSLSIRSTEADGGCQILENDGSADLPLKTLIMRIPNHTFITRNVEDETSTNEMIDNSVVDLYN
jgi:hypothetical protein